VVAGTAQGGEGVFRYDPLDNLRRLDQGSREFRYFYDANNRLAEIKSPTGTLLHTFGYDARGNTTSKDSGTLTFDRENRLTASALPTATSYVYDGLGRRVAESSPVATYFYYSHEGKLLFTNDHKTQASTDHIYLSGSLVAARKVPFAGGSAEVTYQHTDALGSPVAFTDAAGTVVRRERMTAWGEPADGAWTNGPGYTGHQMDAGSKLVYMQQRYYDPSIGRFLSVDPLVPSNVGGNFNRYWYGNNSPNKYVDPDGRLSRIPGRGCFLIIYCDRAVATPANHLARTSTVPEGAGESSQGSEAEEKAWEATEKQAGADGIVELDYETEFLDVFRYEYIRINAIDQDVGGLAALDPYTFLHQIAYRRGDSKFYGAAGGRLFRIRGAPANLGEGPHLGGNLNYVTQGMIFAAAGRSKLQAMRAVRTWNATSRTGSPQYREIREKMAAYGYELWSSIR